MQYDDRWCAVGARSLGSLDGWPVCSARLARLGLPLDRSKYVAGGLVVLDPYAGRVKWSVQLDLTTDSTKLRAYIYSAPTVADLDADGRKKLTVRQQCLRLFSLVVFVYVFPFVVIALGAYRAASVVRGVFSRRRRVER